LTVKLSSKRKPLPMSAMASAFPKRRAAELTAAPPACRFGYRHTSERVRTRRTPATAGQPPQIVGGSYRWWRFGKVHGISFRARWATFHRQRRLQRHPSVRRGVCRCAEPKKQPGKSAASKVPLPVPSSRPPSWPNCRKMPLNLYQTTDSFSAPRAGLSEELRWMCRLCRP